MTSPQCRNPGCDSDEFAPCSWLDPNFCSGTCREAWCRVNGRRSSGEPIPPIAYKPDLRETTVTEVCRVIADATPTAQQAGEHLRAVTLGLLIPTEPSPVLELVVHAPTLVPPGWLARLLRRLFG